MAYEIDIDLCYHNDFVGKEITLQTRVSVQGVTPLGGHFACLCRDLNFMK